LKSFVAPKVVPDAEKGSRLASMTAALPQLSFAGVPLRRAKWNGPDAPFAEGVSTTMKYCVPAFKVTDSVSPLPIPRIFAPATQVPAGFEQSVTM
jgi:hypothetical protein